MRTSGARFNLSTGGGLLAILLWSATIALARSLSEQLGPLTAAAVVYLVAGGFCVAHLLRAGASIRQLLELPRKYVFGCGFLFVLCTGLIFLAVGQARDREQALEIGLINYLWPASTLLLSPLLLNKRASLWLIPGLVSCAYLKVAPGYRLWVGCVVMVIGSLVSWRSLSDKPSRPQP